LRLLTGVTTGRKPKCRHEIPESSLLRVWEGREGIHDGCRKVRVHPEQILDGLDQFIERNAGALRCAQF